MAAVSGKLLPRKLQTYPRHIANVTAFMDRVVKELELNVVGESSHQFKRDNSPMVLT
jgi:hypothetical protein